MPSKLTALNIALAAVSAVLMAYIVRQLLAPTPLPVPGRRAPVVAVATAPALEIPRAPAGAYSVVAARNLFSPTRTEGPASTSTANISPLVRPNLFGIVVREGGSIAYLEDPVTKRVVGYRVGDKIIGGSVQSIKADAVVIERPDGPVDVRLRDPGKPRAVSTAGQPGIPQVGGVQPGGLQSTPPTPALPGVIPPAASPGQANPPQVAQPPQPPPQPAQPAVMPPNAQPPGVVPPGSRRALPPNLLRRVPPGMGDAPQQ